MSIQTYYVVNPAVRSKTANLTYFLWRSGTWIGLVFLTMVLLLSSGILFIIGPFSLALFVGMMSAPGVGITGFYGWQFWREHVLTFRVDKENASSLQNKWCDELITLHKIEEQVVDFLKALRVGEFAYEPAQDTLRSVREILWESTRQYTMLLPFLGNVRDTTLGPLNEELTVVRRHVEQLQIIADQAMLIGVKASNFTSAPKTHLEILKRELESRVRSLDELKDLDNHSLPAVGGTTARIADYDVETSQELILERERATDTMAVIDARRRIATKEEERIKAEREAEKKRIKDLHKSTRQGNYGNTWWGKAQPQPEESVLPMADRVYLMEQEEPVEQSKGA